MLGGGRGSWTPVLLEENDRLAPGHHHSGSNSAADLATTVKAQRKQFSYKNNLKYGVMASYIFKFNYSTLSFTNYRQ